MRSPVIRLRPPSAMDRSFAAPLRDMDFVLDRRGPMQELLSELPADQREAIRLFYLDDLSIDEVARRLRCHRTLVLLKITAACAAMREQAGRRFPTLCGNGNGAA